MAIQANMHQTARDALDELLAWEELERSPRLALFLRYIVERTLKGEASGLKAYSIAVDVFERPANFDPQKDPIVRVQAARLRALLERFYAQGLNTVPMRVSVPIGRYVPRFEQWPLGSEPAVDAEVSRGQPPPDQLGAVKSASGGSSRNALRVIVAVLLLSILMVLLAIWLMLNRAERGGALGDAAQVVAMAKPTVRVAAFENLTGVPTHGEFTARMTSQMISNLSRFEDLRVEGALIPANVESLVAPVIGVVAPVYVLSGAVRREGANLRFDILMAQSEHPQVVWTHSISLPEMTEDLPQAVAGVVRSFSAILGSHRGPLHIHNLQRLSLDKSALGRPGIYLCMLLDTLAHDVRSVENLQGAADCFASLLEAQPQSALALAGWAGNSAMVAREQSLLGDPMRTTLFEQTQAARKAVDTLPQSGFAWGQFARVMEAQHDVPQATMAHMEAFDRNPADMDALAAYGVHLAFTGALDQAIELMDMVFKEGVAAPAWYQIVPALKGLRDRDYNAALASALNVMGGDPELGMVLALSAAPMAARGDVVSRFVVSALANENFQRVGILPWVSRLIADEGVLRLLEPGLQLAGLPVEVIWYPFTPGD